MLSGMASTPICTMTFTRKSPPGFVASGSVINKVFVCAHLVVLQQQPTVEGAVTLQAAISHPSALQPAITRSPQDLTGNPSHG